MPVVTETAAPPPWEWDASQLAEPLRAAAAGAALDELLNLICAKATEQGVPLADISHQLIRREIIHRAPERGSILALRESGWEDLTTVCELSADGKTERRLMRDPQGDFHIVSERFDRASNQWDVTTEIVTLARARHFYVATCIPESLAVSFEEHESPELRLDSGVGEMEALMELMAAYGADSNARGSTKCQRIKAGLAELVDRTSSRVRAAYEAL